MNLSETDILQALMKWRTRLSAAAWVVVRDTNAAEDIFQNVALKAMTREVSFESQGALLSWAFITARREGLDWLRRQRREALGLSEQILELLAQEWQAASPQPSGARIDALRECLAVAPQSARQLLRLRYIDGYSCAEVADQLGIGLNAIYKRISRMHESLRDCIAGRLRQARDVSRENSAMDSATPEHEALLRYLDSRVTLEERSGIEQWLRTDPEARAFLREVAEHSVMIADLARTASAWSNDQTASPARPVAPRSRLVNARIRRWASGLAAAAAVVLLAVAAFELRSSGRPWTAQVAKVTGASQFLGSRGEHPRPVALNARLRPGDSLETRSCDAWIELTLRGGTRLTMAGHSTVRLLEDAEGRSCFKLWTGNLWVSPSSEPALEAAVVHTPAAVIEAPGAQFDLQSSATESLVRVNSGSVRVTRNADGAAVDVPAGHQVHVSVNRAESLAVTAQPMPVAAWSCDLARVPEVILGRWLPPAPFVGPRLGATPLLWPLPDREPVTLYAVALSVARSSDRPILLEAGSRLVFRGRTDRPPTVRFGFSTQRMRGVFAGKFEVDVRPDSLGPAGEAWEVSLPLSDFRPLQRQLSFSPEGLELTDVYALTIQEDAGLEINHIELLPARSPR